jgi:hypothetical protein
VAGKKRCRTHGGAKGSGPPRGNTDALKHGAYTREALARRAQMRTLLREGPKAVAGDQLNTRRGLTPGLREQAFAKTEAASRLMQADRRTVTSLRRSGTVIALSTVCFVLSLPLPNMPR